MVFNKKNCLFDRSIMVFVLPVCLSKGIIQAVTYVNKIVSWCLCVRARVCVHACVCVCMRARVCVQRRVHDDTSKVGDDVTCGCGNYYKHVRISSTVRCMNTPRLYFYRGRPILIHIIC